MTHCVKDPKLNVDAIDVERKHLEGLLKDRTNFYLVFASVFVLGSVRLSEDSSVKPWILLIGTVVSALIAFAVRRTHRLVALALCEIIENDRTHPYARYQESVRFPPNANSIMIWIPAILTGLFVYLTANAFL